MVIKQQQLITMKNVTINTGKILFLLTLLFGCSKKDQLKERPDDIIPSKPCSTLYTSIMDRFPESKNNMKTQEVLFRDTVMKEILLTKESEVFVSFISEGAGYSNSFGFYSYMTGSKPQTASETNMQLLFPNASQKVLNQGDMIQVGDGKFPAGTVIGFFLIVDGWESGAVNYNKTTVFTDPSLNSNNNQQHVLFKQNTCSDIVLAFEDMPLQEPGDHDFNDIIFTVADNSTQLETVSFDLQHIVKL
jgi:hypothetical protein